MCECKSAGVRAICILCVVSACVFVCECACVCTSEYLCNETLYILLLLDFQYMFFLSAENTDPTKIQVDHGEDHRAQAHGFGEHIKWYNMTGMPQN